MKNPAKLLILGVITVFLAAVLVPQLISGDFFKRGPQPVLADRCDDNGDGTCSYFDDSGNLVNPAVNIDEMAAAESSAPEPAAQPMSDEDFALASFTFDSGLFGQRSDFGQRQSLPQSQPQVISQPVPVFFPVAQPQIVTREVIREVPVTQEVRQEVNVDNRTDVDVNVQGDNDRDRRHRRDRRDRRVREIIREVPVTREIVRDISREVTRDIVREVPSTRFATVDRPVFVPVGGETQIVTRQPRVVTVAGAEVKELPKTGLPLASLSLLGLLPIGARLRRFGQVSHRFSANSIWEDRQFSK